MNINDFNAQNREAMVERIIAKRNSENNISILIEELSKLDDETPAITLMEYDAALIDILGSEEKLNESNEYKKYVKAHIKNVKNGYRWMKRNMPELFQKGFFNKENKAIRKAIHYHDKSKWSKDEYKQYKAYDDYRHGKKDKNDPEYENIYKGYQGAWNHHQKSNKHHWQYWIITKFDGSQEVLDMPYENIIEMICDWWTFSWKENNPYNIFDWYKENKDKMILSPATRSKVEEILRKMRRKIEEMEADGKLVLKEKVERYRDYWVCPNCGAHLDHGERCDCQDEKRKAEEEKAKEEAKKKEEEEFMKAAKPVKDKKGNILYYQGSLFESRLPEDGSDPQYGVPEQKKYPLFDKKHVLSAIKLFGHVDPRFEEKLAKAIIAKMRKYQIPYSIVGEENKLYKYLPAHDGVLTEGVIYEDVTLYENELIRIYTDTSNPLRYKQMSILESVLDPIQKERCKDIFDSNDKMHPSVKKFILNTFMEWKNGLDKEDQFTVDKVYLIGSSSGFQYTPSSDCDITIISHDYTDDIWDHVKATMPNGNNLPGTEHPVNYFVRNDMDERLAENMYNIITDKWEKKTDKTNIDIHAPYVTELAKFFMNSFDLTFSEYERDRKDYLQFKGMDPEKVEISPEERQRALDGKMVELKADLDALRMGNRVLRGFLHDAYDDGKDGFFEIHIEIKNENDDPRYSMNNLVYKTLEKYGYRDRIDKTIKDAEEFIEAEENKK